MKYNKVKINIEEYKAYYQSISGGIDGYYEKTILDADCYEVVEEKTLCYFTVHEERGLTSFIVKDDYGERYSEIFDYVLGLNVFSSILFSSKDKSLLEEIEKRGFIVEVQAYNFECIEEVESSIPMMPTTPNEYELIRREFGEFVEYNNMQLNEMVSFYWIENEEIIAFGGLEPLRLSNERFCISMIVNEKHRGKGFGSEVVKYLIEFLQLNGLHANARCYVLNEASRKTLLKSGMKISNKLLKVEGLVK